MSIASCNPLFQQVRLSRISCLVRFVFLILVSFLAHASLAQDQSGQINSKSTLDLKWSDLPSLPNVIGLAGGFAGCDGSQLLFAGGANFPDAPPWRDGKKVWHDTVYGLDLRREDSWAKIGHLPRPVGYGVALTVPSGTAVRPGVLCCGGSDSERHYSDCFVMSYEKGRLDFEAIPSLLKPCANGSGVIVDGVVYIAGGIETPTSMAAMSNFWSLDLKSKPLVWRELPTWPGAGRMLAAMGSDGDSLYLFSGASLEKGPDAKPLRKYLNDAYRYNPKSGWNKLTDMPRAAVAAPNPATRVRALKPLVQDKSSSKSSFSGSKQDDFAIVILGGDDGTKVGFQPIEQHPGFSSTALVYSPSQDRWMENSIGISNSQVTTVTVEYEGKLIIPSGEIRPGVRTPIVRQLELSRKLNPE